MYKIVSDQNSFSIAPSATNSGEGTLNGDFYATDVEQLDQHTWHIIIDQKSYYVQWFKKDKGAKEFTLLVNGKPCDFTVKDRFDLLLEEMGMGNIGAAGHSAVKAPMPGKVLEVMAEAGKEVKKGEALLVLEAMKMENVLKSPQDGTISAISVTPGDAVEKNTVLIEFE